MSSTPRTKKDIVTEIAERDAKVAHAIKNLKVINLEAFRKHKKLRASLVRELIGDKK